MSELSNLEAPIGANKRRRRIGRGESSGWGKTAGMGGKGQKGRQGGGKPGHGFEGGQMPLQRRLPKRGFRSENRIEYAVVNLRDLVAFEAGAIIDPDTLRSRGLVKKGHDLLKVLGDGDVAVALTIRAHHFSKSAVEKISGAGGTVELIER